MSTTSLIITGANGRMGRSLLETIPEFTDLQLICALVRDGSLLIGQALGEQYPSTAYQSISQLQSITADVVIDFTLPESSLQNIATCVTNNQSMVIGTTGFDTEQQRVIEQAANKIPILQAANMSVGVNATVQLLRALCSIIGIDSSVTINEWHHEHKVDIPSGTAKLLEKVITDLHEDKTVDIHSFREGDIIGEHSVCFELEGEQITISHKALKRDLFAKGALRAARWLKGKPAGLYSMEDVLNDPS
jgi:4-hydroxy-tetrahydrodipicolinate reductase